MNKISDTHWNAVKQALESQGSLLAVDVENLTEQIDEYPELETLYHIYAMLVNQVNATRTAIQSIYFQIVED